MLGKSKISPNFLLPEKKRKGNKWQEVSDLQRGKKFTNYVVNTIVLKGALLLVVDTEIWPLSS